MEKENLAIRISGVKKEYRLGNIGGRTLQADLQSWFARKRGREDPNVKIGQDERLVGQKFMALNGIDLTIRQGEMCGIIGSNGAGKSTLLKLLAQVTAPTEGEIDLYGRVTSMLEVGTGFSFNTMRQNIHKLSNTTIMSPTDTWKLSDANIKPQTGMQVAAGLYRNFLNNTIEVSLEGYYKTMKDYLDYRNGAELLMNHHIETDVLRTEGRAYGVELMVKKTQGKLNGWVSYTYSRTQLRQNDPMIVTPVNKGDWYAADFDKPHDLKFVGNYKFTHRFSFSLNCDYSTGRPITLPVSKYHYGGGEFVYYSDRNQYRIPDFFRMDASFNIEPSHHLTLLTHSTISFGVYNLTGRKNAYSVYYISENGKLKGYKMAIFGVPIPFVSYNIKF